MVKNDDYLCFTAHRRFTQTLGVIHCYKLCAEVIHVLPQTGADVNQQGNGGGTALHNSATLFTNRNRTFLQKQRSNMTSRIKLTGNIRNS